MQSCAAAGRCEFTQAGCESVNKQEVVFVLKDTAATVNSLRDCFQTTRKLDILTIEAADRKHLKEAYCVE